MKKKEAIGQITNVRLLLEEAIRHDIESGALDIQRRNFQHNKLIELLSFLGKITDAEYAEISGRTAEVRFKQQTSMF